MTSPINSTTSPTSAGAAATAAAKSDPLGKDAFLKLLVAQMKNQDPLNPQDPTQSVTQLAQFSALEQAVQTNNNLSLVSTQLSGIASNDAAGLVGKTVTVRGQQIAFDGTTSTGFNVTLAGGASDVKVAIKDQNGKTIRTLDLGAKAKGAVPIKWDGRDDAGNLVAAGSYSVAVNAVDKSGGAVSVSQDVTGVVTGVSFDKGYPQLTLDSGATAPISDLVSVNAPPATK